MALVPTISTELDFSGESKSECVPAYSSGDLTNLYDISFDTNNTFVVVTIDKEQHLFIGSSPVSLDSLSSQLQIFLAKETEKPSVVINGDSVANLGVTIQVMQIIKALGATPVVAVDPSN